MNDRDDFSKSTKTLLANRVGVRCSNPDCRKPTSGANSDPNRAINIGVAAHICAAAEGGPRYDKTMTTYQRKSSKNGIWLCQNCAKLIDSDPDRYPKELLHRWKRLAEAMSTIELEKPAGLKQSGNSDASVKQNDVENKWFPNRDTNIPVQWGFKSVDDRYKLSAGSVVLIAGYLDADVSMIAQSITCSNIKLHVKAIYFNLRDTSDSTVHKLLGAEAFVESEAIRLGMLTEDEWKRITCAAGWLGGCDLVLQPYIDQTMNEWVLAAVRNGNADMVIIDDFDGLGLREDKLDPFMYQLRSAAAESETTVFIVRNISSLPSRIDKRPMLFDPKIGELYKFCDVVQFWYRDEYDYAPNSETEEMELITAKYYTTRRSSTAHLRKLVRYGAIVEFDK